MIEVQERVAEGREFQIVDAAKTKQRSLLDLMKV